MNLGLLLVPALAGYALLGLTYVSRYWFARRSGYALFFPAAIAGVLLLAIARLLAVVVEGQVPPHLYTAWRDYAPFEYAGTVLASALLAVALPLAVNVFTRREEWAKRSARASGDLIECLIQDAIESRGERLIEVSTKGSKCYIGFAQESGVTAQGGSDVGVIPVASGYRHSETRELVITRDYLPTLTDATLDLDIAEFRVLIPLAEIASVRRFDPKAYGVLSRANPSAAQDLPQSAPRAAR